ncbi:hypothetical protein E4U42_004011 [Claviceps africana]|uniref:DUF7820 domain-containing protein n=1 Tax=Claviceps africana TaxID=83212 RepID=A0A8K0J5Q6_9HYPO|nr:hypothetical protein E4U42_004011 [Claviceps africana]
MQPREGNSRLEQTASTARNSIRQSQDDDDYDFAAYAVADGFRPSPSSSPPSSSSPSPSPAATDSSTSLSSPTRLDSSQLSDPSPSTPSSAAAAPLKGAGHSRQSSSTSKPYHRPHDSLTLRNDGLSSTRNGQSSSASSPPHPASQYPGAVQPSHPYQLYPQRTHSNATASTEPLNNVEAYAGPRGPTHPYALYTQNTTTTPDDSGQQAIPVGFNSMGNGYRRQVGPDGEEAGDLIGPLGHMEELPPYTRYPDESCVPKPATEVAAATSTPPDASATRHVTSTTPPPAQTIPGAGGIGLATRNPEFSSTEDDLPSAPQRTSSVRSVPSVESYHQVNGAARNVAEKPAQGKWERRAKKKIWGVVPYWAICLLLSGIVIMGIVMGTVIGTIVTRQRGSSSSRDRSSGQKQLLSNIQFLQDRPRRLPLLDTGCYALPPMDKYQVPKACIKDSSQSPAWSCDMPFRWYSMNVSVVPGAPETSNYALQLAPFDPKASRYILGSQPPTIPDSQRLYLVRDMAEKNRGPAWYLEVQYNKTVILREDQLQAPPASTGTPARSGPEKRHWGAISSPIPGFDKSRFSRKGFAAGSGDKPWICTWPNVKLEVFIYPNQTLSSTTTTTTTTSTAESESMPTGSSDGPPPINYKEPYPKLVKFVERRPDDSPPATCTQYVILDGGRDKVPNLDENHQPITIKISEVSRNGKSITDRFAGPSPWESFSLQERDVNLPPCGCVSFSWSV